MRVQMEVLQQLTLVKNTERWVSLPRIHIGNFGDLRNDPTWEKRQKRGNKEGMVWLPKLLVFESKIPASQLGRTKYTVKIYSMYLFEM